MMNSPSCPKSKIGSNIERRAAMDARKIIEAAVVAAAVAAATELADEVRKAQKK